MCLLSPTRLLIIVLCALCSLTSDAADGVALTARPPWTSSRVRGTPEPPSPFVTERAFGDLAFQQPIEAITVPGGQRMFVTELLGKVYSFVPGENPEKQLVADLKAAIPELEQVYGFEFHPDFASNRYCYVCYVLKPDLPEGTRVSRFTVRDTEPPEIDVATEQLLITWPSGGHNGGCLKFGPDGYLYISTGDGTGPNPPDILRTGQDVTDLLSSILRIDVDQAGDDRPYRIPDDNPFVTLAGARPEVWAYGFRNPWKMSFAPETGDLLVGDVGWELWEMLYRVERGGNYGWAVMEGRQPTNPEWPRGPSVILPPLVDHPHTEAASITGGYVYQGSQLSDLAGAYIYGDFQTGKLWSLRYERDTVEHLQELCDTTLQVICFAETYDGELYVVDHAAGGLHRLVSNPRVDEPSEFPRRLSETGLLSNTKTHTVAPGVVPYSINAQPWADHAVAERWIALTGSTRIEAQGSTWSWPVNSVLMKTLSMDLERGNPATRRRLETQLLHFDGIEWRGYTYAWDDDQQDAVLVDPAGGQRVLTIIEPAGPPEGVQQTWQFASRAECMRCHNPWSGPPIGFTAAQLDRGHSYEGLTGTSHSVPQLAALVQLGIFGAPPSPPAVALADLGDTSGGTPARARAYLHTNCAHCHRIHAGSAVLSQMPHDLPLQDTRMVGQRPTQGTFGIHSAQVVAAGEPYRSVLLFRMAKIGSGRMPHLGSHVVDSQGLGLIEQWISQLSEADVLQQASDNEMESSVAATIRSEELARMQQLRRAEGGSTDVEPLIAPLLERSTGALRLRRAIDKGEVSAAVRQKAIERALAGDDLAVRDLFEALVPEGQRVKRLGNVVDAGALLKLEGNAERGRALLLESAGVQCRNCHRFGEQGRAVGPDLSQIGKKYDRAELLRQILEPSAKIDPQYVTYLAETSAGKIVTGLLVTRDDQQIVLMDAQGNPLRFSPDDLEQLVPQQQSLMPDLLLRDMTPQQVADLLAFLVSQR